MIHIGDEVDFHAISFHDHEPELLSPGDELKRAIGILKEIYEIFPKVDVLNSNHGSLAFRKARHHGLPVGILKTQNEILCAPKGWKWHDEIYLDGVYYHHGKTKTALSRTLGLNAVQGHYHERFEIVQWAGPKGVHWDMRVGCLVDNKSMAMAYNRLNLYQPVIGIGVIIDKEPRLWK